MSSIQSLQQQAASIETNAQYVLRDLPAETPQEIRSMVELIEVEARMLVANARHLRSSLRPLVDG